MALHADKIGSARLDDEVTISMDGVAIVEQHELSGPIAKVASQFLDGPSKLIIGLVSLHVGKPWVKVALQGSRKEFRKLLVRQILNASSEPVNERLIRAAVDREIKLLEIRGEKMDGQRGAKWIVLLDEQQIRGLPSGTPKQQADWLSGKLRTPEQLEEIQFKNFKSVLNTNVRMGVVSGILQIVCLSKLVEDEAGAMAADKTEAIWRLRAGGAAIAATVLEIAGEAVKKIPVFNSALTRGSVGLLGAERLLLVSKVLGVIGGGIMAVWDSIKAYDELVNKRNWGVGLLYVGSAVLGAAVTIGFAFAWCPVLMIVLVAGLVLVAWLLEKYKDNKLQTWLEQCVFGRGEHYGSAKIEMDEFALAIK